jgi:hypothetical protein
MKEDHLTELLGRRLAGACLVLVAIVLPLFLWLVAGARAAVFGLAVTVLALAFGLLLLLGVWPARKS